MIEVLKEAEVTGKVAFVPSAKNLKELTDVALEASTENAEELAKLKKAIDLAMLSISELLEKGEKDE